MNHSTKIGQYDGIGQILPSISIVVIGYNEAENLDKTFLAIQNMDYPKESIEVLYVDSGSTDGSMSIAKKYADRCFVEVKHPCAGRNRNRGLIEARNEIIHFIDGDMAIDKDYLRKAVRILEDNNVHAVVGKFEEQSLSLWNKLSALQSKGKNRAEGFTQFTSTGATHIKAPLLEVNGYDERIVRGEEPELGLRFRNAGYKIWSTTQAMGLHNYGNASLRNYLKRYQANAKSLVQVAKLKGDNNYFISHKKKYIKSLLRLAIIFLLATLSIALNQFLLFIVPYLVMTIFSSRSWFHRANPPRLVILAILLKPIGEVFFYYGMLKEIINYYRTKSENSYYSLEKEILTNNEVST